MTPTDIPVVRRATVGDEEGIARVHVDAWREAYAGIVPAAYLASLSYGNRQAMWTQVLGAGAANQFVAIAEASGVGIVGLASGVVAPVDGTPCAGQLMTLYVLRAWQGHGLGRALFEAVVGALAELGADRAHPRGACQQPVVRLLRADGRPRRAEPHYCDRRSGSRRGRLHVGSPAWHLRWGRRTALPEVASHRCRPIPLEGLCLWRKA